METENIPNNAIYSSKVDYFDRILPTDMSITSEETVSYQPTPPITNDNQSTITFEIPAHQTAFIDLKASSLYMKCKIVKQDGTATGTTDFVVYTNNFLHSAFRNVSVMLSNKLVYSAEGLYPYAAIIKKLCTSTKDDRKTLFELETNAGEAKTEVSTRQLLTDESASFEVCGPLLTDVTTIDKYLPNNVPVQIKLERSLDKFCLLGENDTTLYRLLIQDIHFNLKRVHLYPPILRMINNEVEKAPILIPYTSLKAKTFGIPQSSYSAVYERVFAGDVPSKVIVALVSADRFAGKQSTNPFNFKHYSVSRINVSTDLEQENANSITYNFSGSKSLEGFLKFAHVIGDEDQQCMSFDRWGTGKTLHAFTLNPQATNLGIPQKKMGSVRIKIEFSTQTPEAVVCIVLGLFENKLVIDKHRQVTVE